MSPQSLRTCRFFPYFPHSSILGKNKKNDELVRLCVNAAILLSVPGARPGTGRCPAVHGVGASAEAIRLQVFRKRSGQLRPESGGSVQAAGYASGQVMLPTDNSAAGVAKRFPKRRRFLLRISVCTERTENAQKRSLPFLETRWGERLRGDVVMPRSYYPNGKWRNDGRCR